MFSSVDATVIILQAHAQFILKYPIITKNWYVTRAALNPPKKPPQKTRDDLCSRPSLRHYIPILKQLKLD